VPERGIDVLHTLNAVPITTRPHLVTFEDCLPRTPPGTRDDLPQRVIRRLLHRPHCVRLLAMSQYAIRRFRRQNPPLRRPRRAPGEGRAAVSGRRAAQDGAEVVGSALRLLFVGRDVMRKGPSRDARGALRAAAGGVPVRTDVVSALSWNEHEYIGPSDPRLVALYDECLQAR
jgi:hypothetical protein